ncbi:MAG: hypothetical protein LUE93_04070, partial [Bacteroides sp.]|nr:hypothetical protein [Bacteroides sp.]
NILIVYLISKGVKLGLSLVIILLYFLLNKQGRMEFLVTFMVFYLGYLLYETAFFFLSEKKRKLKSI